MKMKVIFLICLIAASASASNAHAAKLKCTISSNLELLSEDILSIAEGSTHNFGNLPSYLFKLNSLSSEKFEIEVFDSNAPSRSYAAGLLHAPGDEIRWTLWSRDILLEAICRLL